MGYRDEEKEVEEIKMSFGILFWIVRWMAILFIEMRNFERENKYGMSMRV